MSLLVLVAIILAFLRFSFFGSKSGLELMNLNEETTIVEEPAFTISGKIDPIYKLSLNGERIYPVTDGRFEKNLILQEGFNTLVFNFKKFLSQEQTLTKQIFYKKTATN